MQHKQKNMAEQAIKVITPKKEYLSLFVKWDEKIPDNFLTLVAKEHPEVKPNRLNNVRYGKTVDVDLFKEILKITVPQYSKGK